MRVLLWLMTLVGSMHCMAAVKLDMAPGKWQHNFTLQTASGEMEKAMAEMQKQLDAMPAQQRRMMEAMMKSQGMMLSGNGGSIEVCVSAEDIARGQLPTQDGCQQQLTEQDGRYLLSFQCAKPPSKGTGEFRLINSKAYEGKLTVETQVKGKTETMTMQQQGKWLGNCA